MSLSMNNIFIKWRVPGSANFSQQEEKQHSTKCQSSLSYKNIRIEQAIKETLRLRDS